MNLVKLSSIIIPENRQRKTFDQAKINELASSIKSVGLLHPPVVRRSESSPHELVLVAGERRLRALETIKEEYFCNGQVVNEGYTLVTFVAELDALEAREAELQENIARVDLTWQERTAAINALALLREEQKPTITKGEIAKEIQELSGAETINAGYAELQRSAFVAKHLDDPAVANARSLKEAYNIATRKDEALFASALAQAVGETSSEHTIIQGDCILAMRELTPGSFDCIITDPPYGMGADSFGDAGPQHQYADDASSALMIAAGILMRGFELCKPQAHLYMFCDIDHFFKLRTIAANAGWKPWRTPLIWDKGGQMGHNPIPAQGIRRSYETILYCYKGDRPGLVFSVDIIRGINSISSPTHPAEKPAALYRALLSRSCHAGDAVLDPCCGVGPVFEAANSLRLIATGIELSEQYSSIAASRRFTGGTNSPGVGGQGEASAPSLEAL